MERLTQIAVTGLLMLLVCAGAIVAQEPAPVEDTAAPPQASVGGFVISPDGEPVSGAIVRLARSAAEKKEDADAEKADPADWPRVATTGEDGAFAFEKLGTSSTSFFLRVETDNWAPFLAEDVPAGASLTVQVQPGHLLHGLVLDIGTQRPLAGATVRTCDSDAAGFGVEACRELSTSDGGRFVTGPFARDQLQLSVVAPGHARLRSKAMVPAEDKGTEDAPLRFYLPPGANISGRVADHADRPVDQARLVLVPRDMRIRDMMRNRSAEPVESDADGSFDLEGTPVGQFQLRATKDGYAPADGGTVVVEAGVDQTVVLRMSQGASFTVRLLDSDEQPVDGLDVELNSTQRRAGRRFRGSRVGADKIEAGADGRFTVRNLEPGTYNLRLIPHDWADIERDEIVLREDQTHDMGTIVVRLGETITGLVTDAALEPVAEARVQAIWQHPERGFRSRETRTGEDGRYRLPGLEPDANINQLFARADGFSATGETNVRAGDEIDFVLEPTGSVKGFVVLPTGEVPVAYSVSAHRETGEDDDSSMLGNFQRRARLGGNSQKVYADPSGSFELENVEPGTYTIEATSPGTAPTRKPGVRVESGSAADAGTLTLERGITLYGRVVRSADETPVAGVAVQASTPAANPFMRFAGGTNSGTTTVSGDDGLFVLEGLEPGALTVSAEHPDFSRADARVSLEADVEPAELVVHLSQGGTLTGSVRDAAGQPVVGTQIVVSQNMRGGGDDTRMLETDVEGRYRVERLAPGTYQVMRMPDDMRRAMMGGMGMKSAAIQEGEVTVIDFDEAPAIRLSGRLLRGGEAIGEATLIFMPRSSVGSTAVEFRTAAADAAGNYSVGLDAPGEYQVVVQGSGRGRFGGSAGTVQLVVPDRVEVELDIVLRSAGIHGMIVDGDGESVSGAFVLARKDGAAANDPAGGSGGRSGADGSYSVEGLNDGAYTVTVTSSGYAQAQQSVAISETTGSVNLDFRLERGRVLRGRVIDPQGRGVAGAMIYMVPSGGGSGGFSMPSQSDINGAFNLTVPGEGAVDISAVAGGWAPTWQQGVTPRDHDDGEAVVLQVGPGGRIDVRVTGPDGSPVAGVQVSAVPLVSYPGASSGFGGRAAPPTDLNGVVKLDLLAPGAYEVRVPGRTDVPAVQAVVGEGGAVPVEIRLP